MLNKEINRLKFRFSVLKLKYTHWKLVKHYLKTLKFCLYQINKIGIPINEVQDETMKKVLSVYDTTIQDISKEADKIRPYVTT